MTISDMLNCSDGTFEGPFDNIISRYTKDKEEKSGISCLSWQPKKYLVGR